MAAPQPLPRVRGMSVPTMNVPSTNVEPSTRRVEVTFTGAPPLRRLERASGVSDVEADGPLVRCLVAGSFQPFLEALRGTEVLTLESTPVVPTVP